MRVKTIRETHQTLICDECLQTMEKAIETEGCHETLLCADCLREALRLLGEYPLGYGHWTPQP